ncbi:MAG: hypothetical protein N4A59_14850 [Marinifilum sp.]|jgi:hypothetical protein|nr:hypothetical protein [Marinifilum sp.]MCT4648633.1 hypothetical protein [Carboxylicivirga sp.]
MEKKVNITLGQVLSMALTVFIITLGGWINMSSRVKALEVETDIRIRQLETQVHSNKCYFDKILDEVQKVKIVLQNKKDREN